MTRQEYNEMTKEERRAYNTELLENGKDIAEDIPKDELPMVFRFKETGIWYQYNEELMIYDPLFKVPEDEVLEVGKYSKLRKDYLRDRKYPMYVELLLKGELNKHCNRLQEECLEMEMRLMKEMSKAEGLTSELQGKDWWKYAQGMQSLNARVTEIVMNELVYN